MTQTVWMSDQGDRYHATEDCHALLSGQVGGLAQDYELHSVKSVTVAEAESRGKTACLVCGGTAESS